MNNKEFSNFLDMQEKEADQFLNKIDRVELYVPLMESFLANDINCLSFNEITDFLYKLKQLNITDYEQNIIHDMFKHYCVLYYDNEVGFLLFININSLTAKKKTNTKKGFVYVCISDIGLYKIGCSINPEKRVKSLGLGKSIKHKIIHTIKTDDMFKLEKELHNKFQDKKEHSEWFKLNAFDLEYIKGL